MADPLGVARIALGSGSLTLQAVDECIKCTRMSLCTEFHHIVDVLSLQAIHRSVAYARDP